jgi:precorrin-6Y C5,15-methyltransferase (decarboxylating)
VLALTSDGEGPAALARLLAEIGFGASRMTVLEALGGPRERLRVTTASGFDLGDVGALNTVAIEVEAAPGARVLARTAGLSDELFEHDGQITKREIRAITLSALCPRRGELLWDVGAGAGSVAIEWMLADPLMRAVALEARGERAARIRRNAAAFGVPALEIVEGRAPAAFDGLAQPDAVFVGGGASDAGLLEAAMNALRSGGRLVVNAVTLEAEALLLAHRARLGGARLGGTSLGGTSLGGTSLGGTSLGGELIRIAIARAEPVGRMQGWRSAMPLTQWTWVKP